MGKKSVKKYKEQNVITCYRKQYAIGQDGLHLGIITYPYSCYGKKIYNKFAYIYDCGCSNRLNVIKSNIDEIIDTLENIQNLRYLYIFISHIHTDHTKGIKYLCNKLLNSKIYNKIPIRHIIFVLPFMTETEKLLSIGGLQFNDNNNIEEIITFVQNPRNIIDKRFDIQYLNDNPPEKMNSFQNFIDYDIPNTHNENLSHYNPFIFKENKENYSWIVLPYYYRGNCRNNQFLQKELDDIGINIHNLHNPYLITKLKEIYFKYCSDLNLPSLCLYSGTDKIIHYLHTGWLYTGDIDFNKHNRAAHVGLIKHYEKYLNNIRIIQIPHHGSERNSNMNDFSEFQAASKYFITTQNHTNGTGCPHVSSEYKNNPKVILLTETSNPLWSYDQCNGILWSNFA